MTVNQNECVKDKKFCLKPVPGNQIVASVKIKITTVEYPTPVEEKREGDLTPKKIFL